MAPSKRSRFQGRFNEALEAALQEGRTQEQVRKEIGCSKNMIRHWKTGKHLPQHHHAEAISRVLGIPADEMFGEAKTGKPAVVAEAPGTPTSLLERLAELEMDSSLKKVREVRSSLHHLDGVLPDLLDLLIEARRHLDQNSLRAAIRPVRRRSSRHR